MRILNAVLTGLIAFGLVSCSQQTKEHGERQAGKAAYHVAQGAKEAVKKAGHELRVAGEQAHDGWKQAQREQKEKKSK